jgi:putative membrane protein
MPAATFSDLNWTWEPSVLIGLMMLSVSYAYAMGPLRRRLRGRPVSRLRQTCFYLGALAVFVALVSPLDELADECLFSAHMVQHMLLTFAAPPLWLLGTPDWLLAHLFPPGLRRAVLRWVTQPVAAFILFNGVMWLWHWPPLYEAALEHLGLHILEHVLFLVSAVIGWSPILIALPGERLTLPGRVAYIVASMFSCTALAALITLSPRLLYPFYGATTAAWGLLPLADQQLGGLLMWLPGDMIYMAAAVVLLARWLGAESEPNRSVAQ